MKRVIFIIAIFVSVLVTIIIVKNSDKKYNIEDQDEVKDLYEYGDYIDRPSYLFCFENGTVWDSDGYTSVKEIEEKIIPVLTHYVDTIQTIESRNEYID